MEIMDGIQMITEYLPTLKEMAQVGPGIVATGVAVTVGVHRGLIVPIAGIFYGNLTG